MNCKIFIFGKKFKTLGRFIFWVNFLLFLGKNENFIKKFSWCCYDRPFTIPLYTLCKVYLYRLHMLGSGDLYEGLTSIPQQGYLYRLHTLGSTDLCEGLTSIPQQGLLVPFAGVGSGDPVRVWHLFHIKVYSYHFHTLGSGDPVRVLCLFHNKVYLYRLHTLGSGDFCKGLTSTSQQGLFVLFAYVRIRWFL